MTPGTDRCITKYYLENAHANTWIAQAESGAMWQVELYAAHVCLSQVLHIVPDPYEIVLRDHREHYYGKTVHIAKMLSPLDFTRARLIARPLL